MIKNILIPILALSFAACNGNKKSTSEDDFIRHLVTTHAAIQFNDTAEYNTHPINKLLEGKTLVYFMDASCSICIYKFIEFYKQAELACDSKIYVIIDEDYLPQVEYGLSQAEIHPSKERLDILCNTKNLYLNGKIEQTDLNGRVIYGNNKQVTYIGKFNYATDNTF